MNKVLIINLAGRAYSVEEEGYEALRRYLSDAKQALESNPDQAEVLGDIEAAIAEKCAAYLTAHKNVITALEIEHILRDMGPVGTDGSAEQGGAGRQSASPKRLYQVREGAMLSGVCNGLAAYFDLDVTLVRILFVALTILTSGAFILAYFVMTLVIPHADTPQERAAAMGRGSLTAQELIDQAKQSYEQLKNSHEWHRLKHRAHAEARAWKRQLRQRRWSYQAPPAAAWQQSPFWEAVHSLLGIAWLAFIVWLCWWSYNHLAIAHEFFDQLSLLLHQAGAWLAEKVR
jgi:phage shock protein PspC (stress-responsive transcriptional regulator)